MSHGEIGREALETWREKLDFYLEQEAQTSDPEKRFDLQKKIKEARQRIAELTPKVNDDGVRWSGLCAQVRKGRFIPILGSGMTRDICGTSTDIARALTEKHGLPISEHRRDDLPQILQYMAVNEGLDVREELGEQWRQQIEKNFGKQLTESDRETFVKLMTAAGDLSREDENEPHRVLAELPAPIYITANYDNFLDRALKAQERKPRRRFSLWRASPPVPPEIAFEPSPAYPLVFHVFGFMGDEDSLVLTEDNYLDYLIATASNPLVPGEVRSALVDSSLIFLGFHLMHGSFRVLLRLILNLQGRERLKDYPHVAVQVDDRSGFDSKESAKSYIQRYFNHVAAIDVFWGSPHDFLEKLRQRLEDLPGEVPRATVTSNEEWD